MLTVEGRSVYVRNGANTQTVNICTADNIRGTYELIFRLPQTLAVTESDLRGCPSLPELSRWLLDRGAAQEKGPATAWSPSPREDQRTLEPSPPASFSSSASPHSSERSDLFISYTKSDTAWAEWIAWQLDQAGYAFTFQAWDFLPGHDFLHLMERASRERSRMLVVLSEAYQRSEFAELEWRSSVARDPRGEARLLIPVRVEDFKPVGLLGSRIYVDLVGLTDAEARQALLKGVEERGGRPSSEPAFPGRAGGPAVDEAPGYPGSPRAPRARSQHPTQLTDPARTPSEAGLWPAHLLRQLAESPRKSLVILTKLLDRMAEEPDRSFVPDEIFPYAEEPKTSVNNAMGKLRPHFMAHFGRPDYPFSKSGEGDYRRFSMSREQAARWRAVRADTR